MGRRKKNSRKGLKRLTNGANSAKVNTEELIPLCMPPELQKILEEDTIKIRKDCMLHRLPSSTTVVGILQSFFRDVFLKDLKSALELRGGIPNSNVEERKSSTINPSPGTSSMVASTKSVSSYYFAAKLRRLFVRLDGFRSFAHLVQTCFDYAVAMNPGLLFPEERAQYEALGVNWRKMWLDPPKHDSSNYMRALLSANKEMVSGILGRKEMSESVSETLEAYPNFASNDPDDEACWCYVRCLIKDMDEWRLFKQRDYQKDRMPEPSMVYGGFHLLRYFSKFEELAPTEAHTENAVRIHVNLFFEFLLKHLSKTSPTYVFNEVEANRRIMAAEEALINFGFQRNNAPPVSVPLDEESGTSEGITSAK